ncbi:anucleate primary sterigmata protein B [Histoplasma capsulatum var. duboisii H88]|uniref:Anucleate primary sterigmata protein B n=1 Tax=Ajellomyces capsulatus (strain H88) TaxID=544711 RepID=F0UAF8_AJEC8|nr:anucleate primary sterigmata protein B [Histoplasma capsulatum var. duboisii H88]QSS49070.1 anucleate primary sterigmata protein B [Histoplasma capsulatum var. duboisii H88]
MAASRSAPDLHSPPVLLGTNPSLMNKPPAAQKRRSSRVPGGFDTDDELSPMKMEFGDEVGTRDGKPELRGHQEYEERYQPWDDKEKNQPNSRLLREDDTNNNSDNRTKNDNGENVYDPFVLSSKDSPLQLSPRQRPQQEPMSLQSPVLAIEDYSSSSILLPSIDFNDSRSLLFPSAIPHSAYNDTMDDLTNTNDHNDDRDHAHEHKHGNNTQEHGQGDENEQDHIHGDENENSNENFNDQTLPNHTTLDEKEMRQKLLDMESSFLPEPSTIDVAATPGLPAPDDTYLIGVNDRSLSQVEEGDSRATPPSPTTPPGAYKTPAARRATRLEPSFFEEEGDSQKGEADHNRDRDNDNYDDSDLTPSAKGNDTTNISSLETISSSPTAAAAARTVSRAISTALSNSSLRSNASQRRQYGAQRDSQLSSTDDDNADATPRRSTRNISPTRAASRHLQDTTGVSGSEGDAPQDSSASSERRRKRPKFLTSRQSVHRFSNSSTATVGTDTASSEAAMGVDFAIQSGGAAPANNIGQRSHSHGRQKKMELSRSISLGSMASGVSGMSDDNLIEQRRGFSGVSDVSLHTLDEEDSTSQARPGSSGGKSAADPMTPKAQSRDQPPPETAITDHIKDIQIPATLARQFRESTLGMSPDKRGGAPTPAFGRSGKSLTLKEQSSTIDRLSKENFDLKMRIHFLNEALNKRSEEGVKEMISENVELKSDKIKLQKDNQALRRNIRDLEKQLRDRKAAGGGGGQEKSEREDGIEAEDEDGQGRENGGVDEEELTYLRERIETYEVEIERLRSESISRESEKRRLATMVKSLGDGRVTIGSDTGAREERDMWKDMLDAETAAREQAEEENRKLRDELLRMKPDAMSGSRSGGSRVGKLSVVSRSSASERDIDRSAGLGTTSSATLVELELLKQENAELRREVSAQTSMLTSRNREKERLYQEIEDLKLGQRRGDGGRSVAGDSIFERSVSRAQDRSNSHASDGVRSRASDAERESLEIKNGELRDHVSALKLENQSLRTQLDECMSDLVALDRAYQADVEQAEEDLQTMQLERDHALQIAEEREEALQDLKAEAQEELDAMGDELDQKIDECQRMEAELANQHENLKALQAEMRSASEGIIRLEEDAQSNLQKYKAVQQELDDANRELEQMEKSLFEANSKVQRLTVQQESSQNEIAFLREEQDGDKIKIGDLESELKTCQMSLLSEKDRTKELDSRLAEERHQREVVGSKEKQEVQRIMNELNREATTAKDEVRKLKKNLSSREIEATTWKERLMELENSLREALGDLNGTRSSLLASITKLQQELDSTALELESTRTKLDERESLLRNRDALLESHGLETRKLADLLERERQAHRADKHSFEQALKSHHQASRTISQNNSRISDLEAARNQDRKRFSTLEQQYKDQLSERNAMFLTIWKRLSAMCGPDWAHSNSLINGNLPSQEVIGNMLFWPGFSRNLLLALKTVETHIGGFKARIKSVERDLTKEYQNLEHSLNIRFKKLERMEELVQNLKSSQPQHRSTPPNSSSAEISKLRGENRLLKAELNLLQSHSRARAANAAAAGSGNAHSASGRSASNLAANTLSRYSSTTTVDNASTAGGQAHAHARQPSRSPSALSRGSSSNPQPSQYSSSSTLTNNPVGPAGTSSSTQVAQQQSRYQHVSSPHHSHSSSEPSQEKWIKRLQELERRLTAEREARLLDRSGARKRLEEQNARNEELAAELARQKMRQQYQGAITNTPHNRTSSSSGSRGGVAGDRSETGPTAPSRHLSTPEATVADEAERSRAGRAAASPYHHRRRRDNGDGTDHEGEGSGDPDEGEMVIIDHRVSEGSGGYQRHDSEPYSGSYKGHKHSSAAKSTGREQSHLSHGHRQEHRRRGTGTGAGVGADEYDGGDDYEDDYDDEDDGNGTGTDDGEGGLTVEVEV